MGLALWLLTALECRKRSIVLKAVVFFKRPLKSFLVSKIMKSRTLPTFLKGCYASLLKDVSS